ncbi:hypothetical protein GN956_G8489 [Arapaima gigas]
MLSDSYREAGPAHRQQLFVPMIGPRSAIESSRPAAKGHSGTQLEAPLPVTSLQRKWPPPGRLPHMVEHAA